MLLQICHFPVGTFFLLSYFLLTLCSLKELQIHWTVKKKLTLRNVQKYCIRSTQPK